MPTLLEECSNFPSEAGEGPLNPMPVCIKLPLYNSPILTLACFPTGRRRLMNVKGSGVIRANKRRGE
jgi:hypothetical protein